MKDIWQTYKLGDVSEVILGGTPSTTVPEYWLPEIKWVTAKDISEAQTSKIVDTERKISRLGLSNSAAKILPKDTTVIIARGATMGKCRLLGEDMALNQTCYGIVAKENVNSIYLYYYLSNLYNHFRQMAHGSVFDTIIGSGLRGLDLVLPPLPTQRAIAHILGALDDKIALNHRLNATLESIARAIFKSWFIDFDPVKYKSNDETGNIPTRIIDLIPSYFAESEIGLIPSGWEARKLGDVIELAYGRALKESDRIPGNIQVYGSNGQIGWHKEKMVDGPGIVVGRKGNPGIVTWAPTDFYPIDTTFYVLPKGNCQSLYYLYCLLQTQNLPSLAADSAVPGLNRNLAYMNNVLLPSAELLNEFDSFVKPLFSKMYINTSQSRTLAALRDLLLPRLLSGKLPIPDAERLLENTL